MTRAASASIKVKSIILTGPLFCLHALSQKVPNLQLADLTIGYPGIHPDGNSGEEKKMGRAHPSSKENTRFDQWLRARWIDKDWLLTGFYALGAFDNPSLASANNLPSSD
ncbi:hypothetical protein PTTG_07629 [Puccinia triticina 1-1 BBBD Race 1]|uniref:Uncharacterized protein n=1 Tax=Puccinia triticina (isolate 1-1 / race 1 (BBBD)) TaxID=630390 RepID=A0A0C4F3F0_PUCT1|nr:hypothetical protein PTTG_07629 [Puccinia triticina 1-1 BBBD Race 1]